MNRATILMSLLVLAVAVVYVEVRLAGDGEPEAKPVPETMEPAKADGEPGVDSAAFAELKRDVAELRARLSALGAAEAMPEIQEGPDEKPASSAPGESRVDAILARVEDGTATSEDLDRLWGLLRGSEMDRIPAALAAFRAAVKARPDDANAHYGLGVALTARFLSGAVSQTETWQLSMQADQAFTQALELDDHHFGARYSKAISYTFWPPNLGKGPEAIEHFEILVERHGNDPTREEMESVYYNLGKEYAKLGNAAKAKEWYRKGIAVFPDAEEMKRELAAMEK